MEEQVQKLFIFVFQLFLNSLIYLPHLHIVLTRLFQLEYLREVFHIDLVRELRTIVPLLNHNIIEKEVSLLVRGCTLNLEQFFSDLKLVVEALLLQIHLQLSFKNQVENTSFGLYFWDFYQYLLIHFPDLFVVTFCLNHLENMGVEGVVQVLN